MEKLKKSIAKLLLCFFMTSILPIQAVASEYVEPQVVQESSKEEGKIVKEIQEKREPNIKYFLKDDNTYEAVVYTSPVHYLKEGKWEEIDNSLIDGKNEKGESVLQNSENDYKVNIAKTSDSEKLINIKKDKYELSWKLSEYTQDISPEKANLVTQESPKDSETKKEEETKESVDSKAKEDNTAIKPEAGSTLENTSKENTTEKTSDVSKSSTTTSPSKDLNVKEEIKSEVKSTEGKKGETEADKTSKEVKSTKTTESKVKTSTKTTEAKKQATAKLSDTIKKKILNVVEVKEIPLTPPKARAFAAETNEVDNQLIVSNINSKVSYENIEDGVNLDYEVKSKKVKEEIVLQKKIENPQFTFNLNIVNLIPKVNSDNSISFYDSADGKKLVYTMESPFMTDKKGEVSNNIKLVLNKSEAGYTLAIQPDKAWLDSAERAYPVVIDPSVDTSTNINKIHDSYVAEGVPGNNYGGVEFLQVGRANVTKTNRAYISFDMPTIASSNVITRADLHLWLNETNTTNQQIDVHKAKNTWSSSTITWNNQPGYENKIQDYAMVSGQAGAPFSWDVTSILKEWTSTGKNTGFVVKNHNEAAGGYNQFISSDSESGLTEGRPRVTINYTDTSGLEDYWTYHSQDVGRAGTGYVNDYNGNLVFTHEDLSLSGNRMPVSISHIFNSNEKGTSIGYGNGWRLNISQRIITETISGVQHYVYIDEDGTKHYLIYDSSKGAYKDESGIDITMTINASSTNERYVIKDKGDNKLIFAAGGYLSKITDNDGDSESISYNGTTVSSVKDGAGRVTTFDVTTGGYLIGIIDPSGKRTSFSYDGTKLSKITYPDGKYSTYTYDTNNNLTSAINHDGYRINYQYYQVAPYRVKDIAEYGTNSTPGTALHINYGYNTTIYNDQDGDKNVYQFNNEGNTISVRDDFGGALYYKFNDLNKNKLELESKLQKPIMNYLRNHNAEVSGSWVAVNDGNGNGSSTYDTTYKYLGNQSLKAVKGDNLNRRFYKQSVTLEKGKEYTLSSYIKTTGISNTNKKGAGVFVTYKDSAGENKTVYSEYVNETKDWERQELCFKLPSDAASTTVEACVGIVEEEGTAYFDCIQLEDGTGANRYNILENANLTYGTSAPEFWTKNPYCDANDTLVTTTDATYPIKLDKSKKVFKMNGQATKKKALYQKLNLSGKAGDVFVASGWAKGNSVPIQGKRYFLLDVALEKNDGTFDWYAIPFNEDTNEWQYISDKIVAKNDYKSLNYYCLYYENENDAYFDGLQLYKEEFGESYTYDKDGNVISTSDLDKKQSKFEYANNDLVKSISPNGGEFKYEYDGKHNVTKATTAQNVVYTFTYDDVGNPKTARVGETNGLTIQSKSEYTSDKNYTKSVEDSSGNVASYDYDLKNGNLKSSTDAKGNVVQNTYDVMDNLTSTYTSKVDGISKETETVKNDYGYDGDKLKTITHNGFSYNFLYDNLGRNTEIQVGNQKLISNEYESRTGKILSSNYGNGDKVSYTYDNEERVIEDKYNDVVKYRYKHDANDNVSMLEDVDNGLTERYFYDASERLAKIKDSRGNSTTYDYDVENNLKSFQETIGDKGYLTAYNYDKDNRNTEVYYPNILKHGSLVESFPLNVTTKGTKGTKPFVESGVKFEGALTPSATTKLTYDLGIKDTKGSLGVWFTPKDSTSTRYILSSQGEQNSVLSLYLDSSNKLHLAVRNTSGAWQDVEVAAENIKTDDWNFAAITWKKLSENNYEFNLQLNDKIYSKQIGNVLNFTGVATTVGGFGSGAYQLNGQLQQLTSYSETLKAEEIKAIKDLGLGNKLSKVYDSLGRTSKITINTGRKEIVSNYAFEAGKEANTTTTKVSEVDNNGKKIGYTYDANGNIETITYNKGTASEKVIKYSYDSLDELIKEENGLLGKTIIYSYDIGGNITKKIEKETSSGKETTINYTYGDSNWKDKLTNFNGTEITYDAIGNPLTYGSWNYTWSQGRQLSTIKGNGYDISYKYDNEGIRSEKTVNGVTTKYHLVGGNVTYEDNGTDKIYYTHSEDNLMSMNLNGEEYYYVTNSEGDIIGLLNKDGEEVVHYTYDSWGKIISVEGSLKDTVGIKNPYRYRSYRYDNETGLYYLDSRYYNPDMGRFLNADTLVGETGSLLSHNMFAYCNNNPVNNEDQDGDVAWWVGAAVKGALTEAASYALTHRKGGFSWKGLGKAAAKGAVTEVLTGGIGKVAGKVAKKAFKSAKKTKIYRKVRCKITGTGCFTGETLVKTKDGYKPIKDIKVGDQVYAEDPQTKEIKLKTVQELSVKETKEILHIYIDGEEIKTTANHPFWIEGEGWELAGNISEGNKVLLSSGKLVEIQKIEKETLKEPVKVYNFEVEDFHTYFVSDKDVLVHNSGCGTKVSKGWKVGDSINALTRKGNYPSWSTVKSRYWKNTANDVSKAKKYTAKNLARMRRGRAPLHNKCKVPKELHHRKGRKIPDPHNIKNLKEVWPWRHDEIDKFRHYKGPRP